MEWGSWSITACPYGCGPKSEIRTRLCATGTVADCLASGTSNDTQAAQCNPCPRNGKIRLIILPMGMTSLQKYY